MPMYQSQLAIENNGVLEHGLRIFGGEKKNVFN
uniref:Uncharacterized protein n=1 Tax=Anguilla anguilla TaxID=7936 RepID=A0A0E9WE78_ANGAN